MEIRELGTSRGRKRGRTRKERQGVGGYCFLSLDTLTFTVTLAITNQPMV